MRILLSLVSLIAVSLSVAMVFVAVWFAQNPESPDNAVLRAIIGAVVFLLIAVGTGWSPVKALIDMRTSRSHE